MQPDKPSSPHGKKAQPTGAPNGQKPSPPAQPAPQDALVTNKPEPNASPEFVPRQPNPDEGIGSSTQGTTSSDAVVPLVAALAVVNLAATAYLLWALRAGIRDVEGRIQAASKLAKQAASQTDDRFRQLLADYDRKFNHLAQEHNRLGNELGELRNRRQVSDTFSMLTSESLHGTALPTHPLADDGSAPIDAVVRYFLEGRISHAELLKAADVKGLRWGTGTSQRVGTLIIDFSSTDSRIVVIETARGSSDYYIVTKEDAHWDLQMSYNFVRSSDAGGVSSQSGRVRTRKAGRGRLQSDREIHVVEKGSVDVFAE